MELKQCGLLYKDHILLYHPFFRRTHSRLNNFNTDFLQNFIEIRKKDEKLDLRIALDQDLLGFRDSFHYYIELDYWYGPKLIRRDFSNLPDEVTVLGRAVDLKGWSQVLKTDFHWYTRDNIKTLQIEEINDDPVIINYDDNELKAAKYIHSQYDLNKNIFFHLDESIRLYDVKSYEERKMLKINELRKKPIDRIKLFLIQSEMNYNDWIKVVHFFFRGNPYISEFFS